MRAAYRMRDQPKSGSEVVAGCVIYGGRSPSKVANLPNGVAPQGAMSRLADWERVLHAYEEPRLARLPHQRLAAEAEHEFAPDSDGERSRDQGRGSARLPPIALSKTPSYPASFAKIAKRAKRAKRARRAKRDHRGGAGVRVPCYV